MWHFLQVEKTFQGILDSIDLLVLRSVTFPEVVVVMTVVRSELLLLGRRGRRVCFPPSGPSGPATSLLLELPLASVARLDKGSLLLRHGVNVLLKLLSLPAGVAQLGLPGLGYLSQGILHPFVGDDVT